MSLRVLASTSILATATLVGAPTLGQQIYYEDGDYLFAVPRVDDPQDSVVTETEIEPAITDEPVLRPVEPEDDVVTARRVIPSRTRASATPPIYRPDSPRTVLPAQRVVYAYPATTTPVVYAPAGYAPPAYVPAARSLPAQPQTVYAAQQQPGFLPGGGRLVEFDRAGWIEECRDRLDTHEESDRSRVLGALVGGAAGGVIGNRVAGSGERLGGTLIGAGTGALAGMAVGDALDDAQDSRSMGSYAHCEAFLDDYLARASQSAPPTTTVAGQHYMLVPVTVPVAQEAVYREYVSTEE